MADFQTSSLGGQTDEGAPSSSSNIEDNAMTNTDDNQWEALPSSSTMELDQPGGSFDEHRYVSSNELPRRICLLKTKPKHKPKTTWSLKPPHLC
jgi:hypothetical protein